MPELFSNVCAAIHERDIHAKCTAAKRLAANANIWTQDHSSAVERIEVPGLPENLELVPPRQLKRRGMQSQQGRNTLMHAVAHIEFNAINLALDAAYRFRNQGDDYYRDWLNIAADEARHFMLIRNYLVNNECDYGHYPVHNGLWEMAVETDHDVLARMALVPRVLEARGLDVTPGMIEKLQRMDDADAVAVLNVIYQDEIGHVAIGSKWFNHHCKLRDLEPRSTFTQLVAKHLHGELRGPFNTAARLQAGFDAAELEQLV